MKRHLVTLSGTCAPTQSWYTVARDACAALFASRIQQGGPWVSIASRRRGCNKPSIFGVSSIGWNRNPKLVYEGYEGVYL
jgi:hypothetical protein